MNIPCALLDCLKMNKIPYDILPHAKAFTARMDAAAEHIGRNHQGKSRHGKLPKRPCNDGASC